MTVVLGVDAAWTQSAPSGVAVVAGYKGNWSVKALAPSYYSFFDSAAGGPISWTDGKFRGSVPDVERLLDAAAKCAGAKVSVVAVDMPLGILPITSRRPADDAISVEFGARGCSTHTPSSDRPGSIGVDMARDLHRLGYPIATAAEPGGTLPRTIEVYPHPALLSLLRRGCRVPYKVAKSTAYWPRADKTTRIHNLLNEMNAINEALRKFFGDTGVTLPQPATVPSLTSLKRYEDALDALVCAWVGVKYVERATQPFGDETSAIWVPQ